MSEIFTIPSLEPGLYKHFKGNKYKVLGVGYHTETEEYCVVYVSIEPKKGTPAMWLRPYDMFIETVEVDGTVVPRFQKIGD